MKNTILDNCLCLGAYGYPIAPGKSTTMEFSGETLEIRVEKNPPFTIPYLELEALDITGPGTTVTGGGFIGGGFGVAGAVEGIAIAAILNSLTTKSKIHTFLLITTNVGELHFHYSGMEPGALRIALARTFTVLRRLNASWQRERLACLDAQRAIGALSETDFERFKERLIREPEPVVPATPPAISNVRPTAPPILDGPKGRCPSCLSTIFLASEECPKCGAIFTEGAAWKITPL